MENLSYKNRNIQIKSKNTWYNWLTNNIPEPINKIVGNSKDKVVSLFRINTHKEIMYERGKSLNKPKRQRQSEENIIKSIRNLFILKIEK